MITHDDEVKAELLWHSLVYVESSFEARRQVRSKRPEVVFVVERCKDNVEWLAGQDVQAL